MMHFGKELVIEAYAPNLAEILLVGVGEEDKRLIDNLPRPEFCALPERNNSILNQVFCQPISNTMLRMGYIEKDNQENTLWAFLSTRAKDGTMPVVQYVMESPSLGFSLVTREAIDKYSPKYRPEFSFTTTGHMAMGALIKHYFFKSGVTVPYRMEFKRPTYPAELIKAARQYAERHAIHNSRIDVNVKPFRPINTSPIPLVPSSRTVSTPQTISVAQPGNLSPINPTHSCCPTRSSAKHQSSNADGVDINASATGRLTDFKTRWKSLLEEKESIEKRRIQLSKEILESEKDEKDKEQTIAPAEAEVQKVEAELQKTKAKLQTAVETLRNAKAKTARLREEDAKNAESQAKTTSQKDRLLASMPSDLRELYDLMLKWDRRQAEEEEEEEEGNPLRKRPRH